MLSEILAATLSPDPDVRNKAEDSLRDATHEPNHLSACLSEVQQPNTDYSVKLAALVHAKNVIQGLWENSISSEEKSQVQSQLVGIIDEYVDAVCDPNLSSSPHTFNSLRRNQLLPMLESVILINVRTNMSLVEPLVNDVGSGSIGAVYTSLFAVMTVCRSYRWTSNNSRSSKFDPFISHVFPTLVEIANSIVNSNAEITEIHAEIVKFVVKSFKFATYIDLPVALQDRATCLSWVSLQLSIISSLAPDHEQWTKCKKWSYANLSRVFSKFGTPISSLASSSSVVKERNYLEFKIFFLQDFVPEIINTYLTLVSQWCANQIIIPKTCLYHLLGFLDCSIKVPNLWKQFFKPHLTELVAQFVFPLVGISDELLQMCEDDPIEYIHVSMDIFEDDSGFCDLAALNLVTTLAEVRPKSALPVILQLCQERIVASGAGLDDAKTKEAAFRALGAITHVVSNPESPVLADVMVLIKQYIVPSLASPHAFLRARGLELLSKFSMLDCNDMLYDIYNGIISNLYGEHSTALPAQAQAALALQSFLVNEQFRDLLANDAVKIMQKLLTLSSLLDLDMISGVMQEIVENFSAQLQPFGVDLMKNLSQQVISAFEDEDEGPQNMSPDRIMMVNGVMNTMITILLSFENSSESISALEESFLYVVKVILDLNLDNFYAEVFELLESSSFLSRSISKNSWMIFSESLVAKNFKAHEGQNVILTFLPELTPALKNFLCFGAKDMNEQKVSEFLDVLKIIYDDGYFENAPEAACDDENYVCFCDLAIDFVLSLKQKVESVAPLLIEMAVTRLVRATCEKVGQQYQQYQQDPVFANVFEEIVFSSTRVQVLTINLIIAGLVYCPNAVIGVLDKLNFIEKFFASWASLLGESKVLKRVFDLKLTTLGLLSILSTDQVSKYSSQINGMLIFALQKLPDAIKSLERRQSLFENAASSLDFDEHDISFYESQFASNLPDEDDGDDWIEQERQIAEDSQGPTTHDSEYTEFFKSESEKVESEMQTSFVHESGNGFYFDNDALEEDGLSVTPLDSINVFAVVRDCLSGLQREKYEGFVGELTEQQRTFLQELQRGD